MEYFSFETTKKYTKAVLDIFNDIQVKKYIDETQTKLITVPITFSSKDAAIRFNEIETEQLLQGNYNVLPRMSLALIDMSRNTEIQTSKYQTINYNTEQGDKATYQLNCVPYDYTFSLSICARSLTDLTAIIEQILPFFNPTYTIRVRELDWLTEPTSIPIEIASITFDLPEDYEGLDIRIVSAEIQLRLKGNIYPPIKESAVIRQMFLYFSAVKDFNEVVDVHSDEVDRIAYPPLERISKKWNSDAPEIEDVLGKDEIKSTDNITKYKIIFKENGELTNIRFMINVIGEEEKDIPIIVSKSFDIFYIQITDTTFEGEVDIEVQAINSLGLQSNKFIKKINVVKG